MNYIGQMNGFRRWRREHVLPSLAQLLWYTLTTEQNQRIWPEEFEMSTACCASKWAAFPSTPFVGPETRWCGPACCKQPWRRTGEKSPGFI